MKWKLTIFLFLMVATSAILIQATHPAGFLPTPLKFIIPAGWPKPTNDIFLKNKLTEEGFQLGKKLFYDPRLSKGSEISCGSCHQQFAGFATFDHDLSHGVNNTFTNRNSPGLVNLAWMKDYHWDGGVNHIEVQPLSPITAKNEMDGSLDSILIMIKKDTAYKRMFKSAFGDATINSQRMLKALAQFTGTLVSANSKYDKVKRGEAVFNQYEERGYEIFKKNCAGCHKEPLFTDNSFRNNGLPLNRFNDAGRQLITGKPEDSLKFKVPTLRNLSFSNPYMHDGSVFSVSQAIDHYTTRIVTEQPTLDTLLRNRLTISRKEKNELMYFLFTLNDTAFIQDKRFSEIN